MLYREIMAVCSEIHTKHINTLCGQNAYFNNDTPEGIWSNYWLGPNTRGSCSWNVTLCSPNWLFSSDCSIANVNKKRPLKCWGIKRHGFTRHKTSTFSNAAVRPQIYHKVLILFIACSNLRLALITNLAFWSAFSLSGAHWMSPCRQREGMPAGYASSFTQECTNPRCPVVVGTKFCKEAPEVCGTPEWNFMSPFWRLRVFGVLFLFWIFGNFHFWRGQ